MDLVFPGLCEFIFLSLVFGTKAQLLESQRASYFSAPCRYSNCITIFIDGDGSSMNPSVALNHSPSLSPL